MALLRTKEYVNDEGNIVIFSEYGRIDEAGNEIVTATVEEVQPNLNNIVEEKIEESISTSEIKMQLDNIQSSVEKSNDELSQEGAEAVTLELIERGIL